MSLIRELVTLSSNKLVISREYLNEREIQSDKVRPICYVKAGPIFLMTHIHNECVLFFYIIICYIYIYNPFYPFKKFNCFVDRYIQYPILNVCESLSGAFFHHCEKVFNQIFSVIQSYPMDQVIPWNNVFRDRAFEYFIS